MPDRSKLQQTLAAAPEEYAAAFGREPSALAAILHVESMQIASALAADEAWSSDDRGSIAGTLSAEPMEMAKTIAAEPLVLGRLLSVEAAAVGKAADAQLQGLGNQLAASPDEISSAAQSGEPEKLVSLLSAAASAQGL